jgi:uncharacterized membrane protein
MLLVFLAHFAHVHAGPLAPPALHPEVLVAALTQLASPSFVTLSGLMLGLLYARRPEAFSPLRVRYLDRGLFLLSVGHLLILPTHLQWVPEGASPLRILFITDTVAVALLLGPLLLPRLGARGGALLGLALILGSWGLLFGWALPVGSGWRPLKHALVGHEDVSSWIFNFPLLPWLGLFLASSALGQRMGRQGGRGTQVERDLRWVGSGLLLLAALGAGAHLLLRAAGPEGEALAHWSSPFQKLPPGPTYFALGVGVALHLLALLMAAERRGRLTRLLELTAQLGRHSLFAFIAQYYVYYVGVRLLRPESMLRWPLLFAATVALLLWLVRRWEALGGGRWLTVGLRPGPRSDAPALPPAS